MRENMGKYKVFINNCHLKEVHKSFIYRVVREMFCYREDIVYLKGEYD